MGRLEIKTEQLLLRPPTLEDVPAIHAFCDDPDIAWCIVGAPTPYPAEYAEKWVRECAIGLDNEEKYAFLICIPETGEVIGDTMLNLDVRDRRAELGYLLAKSHRGKGYAFEAASAIVDFGFRNLMLNKIYAGVWTANQPSVNVLEKLGFTREGVLRQHDLKWGEFLDDARYGLLRSEWEQR